ncbi:hypothetical protein B0H14DRAFT_3871957 [Mycena olivaceomarginata]|nr:hypothetical protein B0H14DRAFT_3871957 [Mycena olivaceomarginata]
MCSDLTDDAWTASNGDGYLGVSGHWIEEVTSGTWESREALISFVRLNNAHNGMEAIIAGDYKLEPEEYWANVSDTARDFVRVPHDRPRTAGDGGGVSRMAAKHGLFWITSGSPRQPRISSAAASAVATGDEDDSGPLRRKALRVPKGKTLPYDPTHALILCSTRGYTRGLVLLWEHMGMYEDVLRFWMDSAEQLWMRDIIERDFGVEQVTGSVFAQ